MADKDVFGFVELEKSFQKLKQKYPNEADRLLMTYGKLATRRIKQLTPVYQGKQLTGPYAKKPRQLKKSWTLKPVKLYKNGTVRVVRFQSKAPHTHLIEEGHQIITRTRTREANGLQKKSPAWAKYQNLLIRKKRHLVLKVWAEQRRINFERKQQAKFVHVLDAMRRKCLTNSSKARDWIEDNGNRYTRGMRVKAHSGGV